jgi:hypothetical protein
MKLVKLIDSEGKEVWVNPDRISTVRVHGNGGSVITFGLQHTLWVKEEPSAVASMLFQSR